jgi:hypothetical protein
MTTSATVASQLEIGLLENKYKVIHLLPPVAK